MKYVRPLLFFALLACIGAGAVRAAEAPELFEDPSRVTLRNEFICVSYDLARHAIVSLSADFSGEKHCTGNLLAAGGIAFEMRDGEGKPVNTVSGAVSTYHVLERGERLRVAFDTVVSQTGREGKLRWTLTLNGGERGFRLDTVAEVGALKSAAVARLRFYLPQWFLLGLYDRGAMQFVGGQGQAFYSSATLREFYTMDRGNGSVAIVPEASNAVRESNLLSGSGDFSCALEQVFAGTSAAHDAWAPLAEQQPADVPARPLTASYRVYANDLAFPVHHFTEGPNMPRKDLEAWFLAIYGSAAGVLGGYTFPGSAYPALAAPRRPYRGTYNYFDPDAWSTVATLSFSGNPVLQEEARKILETSERRMTAEGQVPHHFAADGPTYISLAKSSQTGPNIFWILAALDYVSGTGNEAWLKTHYPSIRRAADWLLGFYDPQRRLLSVKGSLFIDVFVREHFTLDTNVMMVRLLQLLQPVAAFCGDEATAGRYADFGQRIRAGVLDGLWDGHNHFVTQRNLDGSVRDKVDYDGNYAALAFGLVDDAAQRQAIFARLDGGPHTHPAGRGTWVSERFYERDDCFLGNTGDSDIAMARIWWLDMAARYRNGDLPHFESMLRAVQGDLLKDTWMGERYDAAGHYAHNPCYHEYPEILTMVLREMRYGIDVKIDAITIRPFGLERYDFRAGGLEVHYSPQQVRLRVPGSAPRAYRIYGLAPEARYQLSNGEVVATDAHGVATFRERTGMEITLDRAAAGK